MQKPDSMLLLEESAKIEVSDFWKRYIDRVATFRQAFREKCYERGDKEYEKGVVHGLDLILGYRGVDSMMKRVREDIGKKSGVAGTPVLDKE